MAAERDSSKQDFDAKGRPSEVPVEQGVSSSEPDANNVRARLVYLCLGWLFFALGMIGVVLPIVPTTPFMLLSVWAFSKSSKRFEQWLVHHRWFGPGIRRFRRYRVVPLRAKLAAWTVMALTLLVSLISGKIPWYGLLTQGLLMGYGAWFIARCPSRAPKDAPPPKEGV